MKRRIKKLENFLHMNKETKFLIVERRPETSIISWSYDEKEYSGTEEEFEAFKKEALKSADIHELDIILVDSGNE